jgi:hypothetical protein
LPVAEQQRIPILYGLPQEAQIKITVEGCCQRTPSSKWKEMGKKKDWSSLLNVQPPLLTVSVPSIINIDQLLLTAKENAIRDAVAALKPITTFRAIGEQISYSRQSVSKKMQERFRGDPAAMWKIGDDWKIPRKTAEVFIREVFGA